MTAKGNHGHTLRKHSEIKVLVHIAALKATQWVYLVSTPLGMLSDIPRLIIRYGSSHFLSFILGRRNGKEKEHAAPTLCDCPERGKTIITHFSCHRQE